MTRYILLLRGVNVGGKNRVKMADLRAALGDAGLGSVATYIQSGTIAADSDLDADTVVARTRDVLARVFGLEVSVMVRTQAQIRALRASAPFPEHIEAAPNRVLVMFAPGALDRAAAEAALAGYGGPESVLFTADSLVVWFPDGQGRSKFPMAKLERAIGGLTARNWNAIVKLAAL